MLKKQVGNLWCNFHVCNKFFNHRYNFTLYINVHLLINTLHNFDYINPSLTSKSLKPKLFLPLIFSSPNHLVYLALQEKTLNLFCTLRNNLIYLVLSFLYNYEKYETSSICIFSTNTNNQRINTVLVVVVIMNSRVIYLYFVIFSDNFGSLEGNWLSVHSADLPHIMDHFIQFGSSTGFGQSRRSFMHLIWFATTWVIWKQRNARIFRGNPSSPTQLLENVKLHSFWWFKANARLFFICCMC